MRIAFRTWSSSPRRASRVKKSFDIPIVLKDIGTAVALECGADCIYMSNHGGRQLDQGVGSIDVLPEVVEAVGGRARIMVDGGIYRGTDVVTALILGADVVSVGRLYIYGLAAAGTPGVVRLFEILEDEIRICLSLFDASEQIPFRAGNLDDAVLRRRERHLGDDGSIVVRCDGLEQAGRKPDYVSLLTFSGNAAEEFQKLGRADDVAPRECRPRDKHAAAPTRCHGRDPANYRVSRRSVPAAAEPAGRTRDPREPGIARDRAPAETRRSREWCAVP